MEDFELQDGFFDDYEEESIEEETMNEESDELQEEVQEEKVEEPFMTVRYNKENKNLTRDEAIQLAQKGMNYDHIYNEYQAMNNQYQSLLDLNNHIQSLANSNGMEMDEYLEHLNEIQENYAVSRELQALRETYPDADDELLTMLAESNVQRNISSQKQENFNRAKIAEQERTNQVAHQVEMLEKRYPEANINELVENQAFLEYITQGYSVLESYQLLKEDERAVVEKHAQKDLRNIENKARSLGNTTNSGDDEYDDFLSGFDSI